MSTRSVVTLRQASDYFRVDIELVRDFAEYGLYPTVLLDGEEGLDESGLERLKKVLSLHRSLGINKEGIEAVLGLRERITGLEAEIGRMQDEVRRLRRHLAGEDLESLARLGLVIEVDSGE